MQKLIISFLSYLLLTSVHAEPLSLPKFIDKYCSDCHADGADKGGLDFDKLKYDLKDAASFAKWEQIYDRVLSGEMPPPKKKKQPTKEDLQSFDNALSPNLLKAHTVAKGTVLRRLNRQEYENTLNDMFGTNLMISEMLPEDGRSHEFDNVGEALGMSMGQLQRYIDITEDVINAAVETRPEPPEINERIVNYNHKGYAKHIGKKFKKLEGDTIVRFSGHVWPDGILQSTNMKQDGFFEVEITGYGYQSEKPMIFSASAKGYAAGSPKPHFGYFSFAPNKMSTVKFTGYLHDGIMLKFEPYGINYKGPWLKPKEKFNPNTYKGPGFAVKEVKVPLKDALKEAFQHPGFWFLCSGFFVCGFHVVFIATHLPSYVMDLGFSASTGAWALGIIGLANVVGGYLAGVLGGKYSKKYLLSFLYFGRALVMAGFILLPPSEVLVFIFAIIMGLFWLSTVPLTTGLVADLYGLQHMSTLFGLVFLSHQLGAFLGGWLGGYFYDNTGSYNLVWWISVGLGIISALVHWPIHPVNKSKLALAT